MVDLMGGRVKTMSREGVLYKSIVNYFTEQINTGKLRPDDKILTEMEIGEQFGVSRITVIRAIKELQLMGYIYRIKGKGSFVARLENQTKKKSNLIGLVVSYNGQLEPDFLEGVEGVVRSSGYYLTIHNTGNNYENERKIISRLAEEAAGLILYVQPNEERNLDVFSGLIINQVPVVLMDTQFDEYEMPFVSCNNKKAFFDLTNHVLGCGHRKIAYVGSFSKAYYSTLCRYQGYCSALIQAGVPLRVEYIYDRFIEPDQLRDSSAEVMEEQQKKAADRAIAYFLSLDEPPTALMAVNDKTAIHLLYAAMRRGLHVPEQLSITGFDNLTESRYLPVGLTTVDQQFKQLGEKAAKLVMNQVLGSYLLEKKHEISGRLLLRDSVKQLSC